MRITGRTKRVAHHLWLTLSCSFMLQVLLFYLDYHYIQAGPFSSSGASIVLMNIPIVSRLVGHSKAWLHAMRRAATPTQAKKRAETSRAALADALTRM